MCKLASFCKIAAGSIESLSRCDLTHSDGMSRQERFSYTFSARTRRKGGICSHHWFVCYLRGIRDNPLNTRPEANRGRSHFEGKASSRKCVWSRVLSVGVAQLPPPPASVLLAWAFLRYSGINVSSLPRALTVASFPSASTRKTHGIELTPQLEEKSLSQKLP
jgi:hypothetical protein